MNIVSTIFETIQQAVTGFANSLGSAASNVVSLFWTAGEGGTGGSLTFLGVILLIALGGSLVFFVVRLIIRSMRAAA